MVSFSQSGIPKMNSRIGMNVAIFQLSWNQTRGAGGYRDNERR